ncbi:class I SAM-dependent methyltransferase [Micromonosporaceae bacterium Da 78-11]
MTTTTRVLLDVLGQERIARWRCDWDAMMAGFVPAMDSCEQAVFTAVERIHTPEPRRVLDLGGGPGGLADRMAARWPNAAVTLIDLDPVLLALAHAGVTSTVSVHAGDLGTATWAARSRSEYDLVTVMMTMHYLQPGQARVLYRQAHRVTAPGGLLVVADLMPEDDLPTLMAALDPAPGEAAAELAWAQWWAQVADVPELASLVRARSSLFEQRPPAEFTATASWHLEAARAAGFSEAGILWRCGRHAALVAIAA